MAAGGLIAQLLGRGAGVTKGLQAAAGMKKQGAIARMLGEYARKTRANPIAYGVPATAIGVDLTRFGAEIFEPVGEAAMGGVLGGARVRETATQELATESALRSVQERSLQMRESVRRNIQVIAQTNPQLYNELVAGKRLPRGAIVLGGPPRRDLLEEVATMMAGV